MDVKKRQSLALVLDSVFVSFLAVSDLSLDLAPSFSEDDAEAEAESEAFAFPDPDRA